MEMCARRRCNSSVCAIASRSDMLPRMHVSVRVCDEDDFRRLTASAEGRDLAHHRERWDMQQRRKATYLVAWRAGTLCGRVTLFHSSKYENVHRAVGDFPEMNALEATPRGEGIGSAIIEAAERHARQLGAMRIGLAVEHNNPEARRLYERLGYRVWDGGDVVDRWTEWDEWGEPVQDHADTCAYLIKDLG